MRRQVLAAVLALGAIPLIAAAQGRGAQRTTTPAAASVPLTADRLQGINIRSVGPGLVTGRVADIAIDPRNTSTWYVATAFGGLWKTTNRGVTFTPIFDNGGAHNLCCVVLDPKNPDVVWLGTGENHSQRSAHFGDGIYKSTDAGRTWKQMGLGASEHLGKIIIDPRNSDVVYVAAQGPLFSSGGERGLYKTTDGGATWTRVLHISDDTGITDIVMDPHNPDVLYAAGYPRRRHVGQAIGGSPEGGIHKTENGGRTWRPTKTPRRVRVHDFLIKTPEGGKAIPYGVYDLHRNEGWVSVGTDHDTARFAAQTILKWWTEMGRARYPQATELLITRLDSRPISTGMVW